jgi:hypothetical protein
MSDLAWGKLRKRESARLLAKKFKPGQTVLDINQETVAVRSISE